MNGAWITPNGQIHWTNNINSHSQVIKELGIKNELINGSQYINWSKKEKEMYFNLNITYIVMKLGYIRILCYLDQIGIESGISYKKFSKKQIDSIYDVVLKFSNLEAKITVELFQQNKVKQFQNINDFIKNL